MLSGRAPGTVPSRARLPGPTLCQVGRNFLILPHPGPAQGIWRWPTIQEQQKGAGRCLSGAGLCIIPLLSAQGNQWETPPDVVAYRFRLRCFQKPGKREIAPSLCSTDSSSPPPSLDPRATLKHNYESQAEEKDRLINLCCIKQWSFSLKYHIFRNNYTSPILHTGQPRNLQLEILDFDFHHKLLVSIGCKTATLFVKRTETKTNIYQICKAKADFPEKIFFPVFEANTSVLNREEEKKALYCAK